MEKVTVRDLYNYFGYRFLCGDDKSLDRVVGDANVNRPGLELAGYFDGPVYHRIVIFGEKEIAFIKTMSTEQKTKVFEYLTADTTPMILISRDLPCPKDLLEIAERKNFPIFSSYAPTNSLIVEIVSFLEKYFAPNDSYHGTLLKVYGRGVLITGDSGVGKSEIAFELIKRGHILIADDRVDLCRLHNSIYGEAPEILRNLLELRGVGIINVEEMCGVTSTDEQAEVECVIHLEKWKDNGEYDRLGLENQQVETIFGIDLPKVVIPVREGRSIAVVIEAAVSNIITRQKGKDTFKEFSEKLTELISKGE